MWILECLIASFFVEAKRSRLEPDDKTALNQALNDASQALHNMYEFFREAGKTQEFFDHVRVFSATASEKGIIMRVHWATELPEDTELSTDRVVPDYPLQFRYQKYKTFKSKDFDRLKVVEAFERIMAGYGERQLLQLLRTAATNVKKKATDAWRNRDKVPLPNAFNNYRYGQSGQPGSRTTSRQHTPSGESSHSRLPTSKQLSKARRPMQESFTSTASAMTGQTEGESTFLSQGVEQLQTGSFISQGSNSFPTQPQDIQAIEKRHQRSKKRKTSA